MKLYNVDLSPYCSRVRLQLYAKGLEFEAVMPDFGGTYSKVTPIGKVPVLEYKGCTVFESGVINEYIEDCHPTPSLLPSDPAARAQVRLLARIADAYIFPHISLLIATTRMPEKSEAMIQYGKDNLNKSLDHLDSFVGDGGFAYGNSLTLADCALVPALFIVKMLEGMFGGNWIDTHPKTKAYYAGVLVDPNVARVHAEMAEGLKQRQAQAKG